MIHCPRCSVFSALAQIKASAVMIIDCQDFDINLTTTGVQADIGRNVSLTLVYHVGLFVMFCSSLSDRLDLSFSGK